MHNANTIKVVFFVKISSKRIGEFSELQNKITAWQFLWLWTAEKVWTDSGINTCAEHLHTIIRKLFITWAKFILRYDILIVCCFAAKYQSQIPLAKDTFQVHFMTVRVNACLCVSLSISPVINWTPYQECTPLPPFPFMTHNRMKSHWYFNIKQTICCIKHISRLPRNSPFVWHSSCKWPQKPSY